MYQFFTKNRQKIGFLVIAAVFVSTAFLPTTTKAFDILDIFDPLGLRDAFDSEPDNITNVNSNNINSNINSPGAIVNGATNVSTGNNSSVRATFEPGYYVAGQTGGTGSYPNYPYPSPSYPSYPSLDATCTGGPGTVNAGDTVTWRVNVWGGSGSYNYHWSGTDGLSNSGTSIVHKTYTYSGTKTASVTVTSGNQSVTRSCGSVYVTDNYDYNYNYNYNYYNPLSVSCYPNTSNTGLGNTVTWYASVTGGSGGYSYSWSGSDGIYGSNSYASMSYPYPGTKTASVTVYSGGQSITRSCGSVNVGGSGYYGGGNQGLYCSASPTNIRAGETTTWTLYVPGYNNYVSVNWGGTDGLYGSSAVLRTTYFNAGQKTAYANVILPNGQSTRVNCENTVQVTGGTTVATQKPRTTTTSSTSRTAPLAVSCIANTDKADNGDAVVWSANASGGNGSYKYSWTGSDDLAGSNSTIFKSYQTDGTKAAAVTVTSGNQSVTATCANMVEIGDAENVAASIFSLKNIPWGLISILVILVLLAAIAYLLFSKSKI